MNVYELTEKLGGEFVRGKARVRQGGDYIVLGFLNGDEMIFTEEGRQLAAENNGSSTNKRARPAKIAVVESESVVDLAATEVQEVMAAEVAEEVPSPTIESAVPQGLFE